MIAPLSYCQTDPCWRQWKPKAITLEESDRLITPHNYRHPFWCNRKYESNLTNLITCYTTGPYESAKWIRFPTLTDMQHFAHPVPIWNFLLPSLQHIPSLAFISALVNFPCSRYSLYTSTLHASVIATCFIYMVSCLSNYAFQGQVLHL